MTPPRPTGCVRAGLLQPHHDGSARYVDRRDLALGDEVEVRLHVPVGCEVGAVAVRAVVDGEPAWTDASPLDGTGDDTGEGARDGTWWAARLVVENPVVRYRFLLDTGPHGYAWQTAAGVVAHDPADATDHQLVVGGRAPTWAREAVVYQVVPDRFARSERGHPAPPWASGRAGWDDPVVGEGPAAMVQWYGGDLDGVAAHLDHLAELGVTAIWLTPTWPAGSNHRYDATTFDRIDPSLGGDAALARLSADARARGIRLVGDLTTNHTGVGHDWFRRAVADRSSVEAGFYEFRDWPDDYRCWFDVPSLPTLDHTDPVLEARLVDGPDGVAGRWIGAHAFAGWRIDVANMTGRSGAVDVNHDVARRVRTAATTRDPEALVVGEHAHDASRDLGVGGWHATMNYGGFTNPVWAWLRAQEPPVDGRDGEPIRFMGRPTPVPRLPGPVVATSMQAVLAHTPWIASEAAWNQLGSHDTARIRTVVGDEATQLVGATLLATWVGTPVVFAGDEWGVEGSWGEQARVPMPWDRADEPDRVALARAHRDLFDLRRRLPALTDGGLRWVAVTDDTLVFVREHPRQDVLVAARRGGNTTVPLPGLHAAGDRVHGSLAVEHTDDGWTVSGPGPATGIWVLDRA